MKRRDPSSEQPQHPGESEDLEAGTGFGMFEDLKETQSGLNTGSKDRAQDMSSGDSRG